MKYHNDIQNKDIAMLIETIEKFSRQVRLRQTPFSGNCPYCNKSSEHGQFRRHDCRHRTFKIIFGRLIYNITGTLPRWRCPQCNRTFTDYPPFAIAYRQYIRPQIFAIVNLMQNQNCSSRNVASINKMFIFHKNFRNTIFSHTTCLLAMG